MLHFEILHHTKRNFNRQQKQMGENAADRHIPGPNESCSLQARQKWQPKPNKLQNRFYHVVMEFLGKTCITLKEHGGEAYNWMGCWFGRLGPLPLDILCRGPAFTEVVSPGPRFDHLRNSILRRHYDPAS